MRFLLKLLYFICVLIVLGLLLGFLLPDIGIAKASKNIKSLPTIINHQISNIENKLEWMPLKEIDPAMHVEIVNDEYYYYKWSNKNNLSGEERILENNGNEIISKLSMNNYGTDAVSILKIEPKNGNQLVNWEITKKLNYLERYLFEFYSPYLEEIMDAGLDNLKHISEELRLNRVTPIEKDSLEGTYALMIKDSANYDSVYQKSRPILEELTKHMQRRKLEAKGRPIIMYSETPVEGKIVKFACGYPIEKRTWGWKEKECLYLPGGESIEITHNGLLKSTLPYKKIINTDIYKQNNKGVFIERYENHPSNEPDTAKWERKIIYVYTN